VGTRLPEKAMVVPAENKEKVLVSDEEKSNSDVIRRDDSESLLSERCCRTRWVSGVSATALALSIYSPDGNENCS
jgi:hypothetical protein